jgi:hypothetical protein
MFDVSAIVDQHFEMNSELGEEEFDLHCEEYDCSMCGEPTLVHGIPDVVVCPECIRLMLP